MPWISIQVGLLLCVRFHLNQLRFNDGSSLDLSGGEIVVVVGPNNSGKTTILRETFGCLKDRDGTIVTGVGAERDGSSEDVVAFLESHFLRREERPDRIAYTGLGANIQGNEIKRFWETDRLGILTEFFCRFVEVDVRLRAVRQVGSINLFEEPRQLPLHVVHGDPDVEALLCKAFIEAFNGEPLFLNKWAGKVIHLRCGPLPTAPGWTKEQHEEIRSQTVPLERQGDGMKSFVGCLLELLTTPHKVVLIDEPEVFLHPGQARAFGRIMARDKPADRQLIVATHSTDFLRGVLDARPSKLRVVRVTRQDEINPVRFLDPSTIQELWNDSLLRASNIFDGLFHERVVVCESDSDCRFYTSVLEAISGDRILDVMFVHCGGKDKIPTVVKALRAVGVEVNVIADFDVLRPTGSGKQGTLHAIVAGLGGHWADVEGDWKVATNALSQKSPPLTLNQVEEKIKAILKAQVGGFLSEDGTKEIRALLKAVSPWAEAKLSGKNALPSGDASARFDHLDERLRGLGLFVVPVGEMERFVPSVGGHGPSWVNEILKLDLANDPQLESARSFVRLLAE